LFYSVFCFRAFLCSMPLWYIDLRCSYLVIGANLIMTEPLGMNWIKSRIMSHFLGKWNFKWIFTLKNWIKFNSWAQEVQNGVFAEWLIECHENDKCAAQKWTTFIDGIFRSEYNVWLSFLIL
jgi:hypothetical protein